jgi:hypothetical protein
MVDKLLSYLGHSAWAGIAAIATIIGTITTIIGLLVVNVEPSKEERSTESFKTSKKAQLLLNKTESTSYSNNKLPNKQEGSFGRFSDSEAHNEIIPALEKNIKIKNSIPPIFGKFKEKKVIPKQIPALAPIVKD